MDEGAVQRVHGAVDRTLAEGTARFALNEWRRGVPRTGTIDLTESGWGERAAWVGVLGALFAASKLWSWTGGRRESAARRAFAGRVDFQRSAYRRPGPRRDELYVAGRRFIGLPGAWFELPAADVGYWSPLWYLGAARRAVRVRATERATVDGVRYRRLETECDLTVEDVEPRLAPPPGVSGDAAAPVPLAMWLDRHGLIRRVEYAQREADGSGRTRLLELFDFGTQVNLREPPADELTQQDPRDEAAPA